MRALTSPDTTTTVECTATVHNTLRSARRAKNDPLRCICPGAVALLADYRVRSSEQRRHNRQEAAKARWEAMTPEERAEAEAQYRKKKRQAADANRIHQVRSIEHLMPSAPVGKGMDMSQAACRLQAFGGTLTPEQADDFHDSSTTAEGSVARERAKAICRTCPIQYECLTEALERDEDQGVWGGLSVRDRRNPARVQQELRLIVRGQA